MPQRTTRRKHTWSSSQRPHEDRPDRSRRKEYVSKDVGIEKKLFRSQDGQEEGRRWQDSVRSPSFRPVGHTRVHHHAVLHGEEAAEVRRDAGDGSVRLVEREVPHEVDENYFSRKQFLE